MFDCSGRIVGLLRQVTAHLQQLVQEIHASCLLLEVGSPIDVKGKRYVFVSEDFGERLDVKFGNLHRSDSKCVSDFMETHLRQSVLLQESCKELPIGTRLRRLALPG